ncbi:hypothetical protein BUALT_Bualt07G0045200 [Buddleja alternifolia]|uniref:Polynucleotide 5'-hydroxyl-kinase NOL9 n=1 Tax=Buddleja alternifolia TaxID=168488 RepID=A0AAV6XFW3_9LAMI|nr:hypothetical protein BUALT_Bualt07G0045200 [Buddleja alternifolia]
MAAAIETESPSPKIYIPEEWSNAAEAIACSLVASPIAFVCGPKNSGKTTFSRHLVNVLLQRHKKVAYLDTDVGQTEFTPPGLLSLTVIDKITPVLLITSFFLFVFRFDDTVLEKHLRVYGYMGFGYDGYCLLFPLKKIYWSNQWSEILLNYLLLEFSFQMLFFGDISSKRDPTTYLAYISALYDHYLKEYRSNSKTENQDSTAMPLVINTPGWVKGIGYEILVNMLNYMSPTHVLKIRISAEKKNLPAGAFWSNDENTDNVTVIEISAALQDYLKRSVLVQKDARLLRDLRVMAYFRQCFPSDKTISTIKELAHALAAHPPYEVPISSIKIKHLHCQVPETETFYSLNVTIVGLGVGSFSEQLPQCVGLGIVRGIDTFRGVIYVITPVPQQILEDVDLLLQGFIQIPTSLLQVQGCVSPYMSANVISIN